jgi:glycine C-acetyltransferase
MYSDFKSYLQKEISDIREAGLYKSERIIVSPQGAEIELNTGQKVLKFLCK